MPKKFVKKPVRRIRKRVSTKPTKAMKQYVSKAIHNQIENKNAYYGTNIPLGAYGSVIANMNPFSIGPYPSQMGMPIGTGVGNRIGNRISIRKMVLNYIIYPAQYSLAQNASPKPQEVRMFIGWRKAEPTVQPTAFGDFFQLGSSSQAPSGDLLDMLRPVNKDAWRIILTRTHKVGPAIITSTGTVADAQQYANNDFKTNVKGSINLTKHFVKNVIFNDTTQIPTSRNLFCMTTTANSDNSASASFQTCRMSYWIDCEYEDA